MFRTIVAFLALGTLAILPVAAFDGVVLLPDGKPAADAVISIQGTQGAAHTDAQGRFHWTPDPPLPWQIQVILSQGQCAAPVKIETLPSQGPVEIRVTPVISESVTVIASRVPERSTTVPASVTVVSGDDLRSRGARDLRTALAQVTGVDIAPGGDGGPASSVPEMWGLKEFDAFLLVVDGVPWGGAFNPELDSLSLGNVDHIEVLRGAAPVTYGATSFVGVIEVFNTEPKDMKQNLDITGGSYGSYGVRYDTPLPAWAGIQSSINLDAGNVGFKDDRTQIERGHLLWRNRRAAGKGKFGFDLDGLWQHQNPASPIPLLGTDLTSQVPLDSNQNLSDAHINENRFALNLSYQQPAFKGGSWQNALSIYHTDQKTLRGFLVDVSNTNPNAHGFRAEIPVTGVYLDSHIAFDISKGLKAATGVDYLYGDGKATGGDFDYFASLEGSNPPSGDQLPSESDTVVKDRRNFAGAYGQFQWDPLKDWHFEMGLRANFTNETRSASSLEFSTNTLEEGSDSLNLWRGSGYAGVTWTAWSQGADTLAVYTDYRNTYKPAAVDFGLEPDFETLRPETAHSLEAGAKTRLLSGKLSVELSVFRMDFQNLVVAQDVGGIPALVNAGEERFRGFEIASAWRIKPFLSMTAGYSFHDSKFRDFETNEGGTTDQLAGNRLPMSARNMANLGFVFSRDQGWRGSIQGNYIGSRFFDQENTAVAPAYTTLDAGVAYRMKNMELRLDGYNLTDVREPVSESELGDNQFYILPARRIQLSLRWSIGT